ncbi:arsenic resistance N-acetyltransferase ArsN2 [Halorussus amylolyticus]|uniref:arsenic resistance N-acetyltransferase ArsN2 n=1 Tax=Halorussus amylolyticus TaxID=1126242 RepID=UPI0010495FBD|nr:arsenic resistance N-acetyltransferase ArsN2 [Halorussus amylolyticus]
MAPESQLRAADASDREYAERLLTDEGLPVADLDGKIDCLRICEVNGERVGVGGLEICGDSALLRSVAVEETARGNGYGRTICERLLDDAADAGVESAYLLTTTAPEFFDAQGFAEVERESAPFEIRDTTEFAELCPDSAVCMARGVDATEGNSDTETGGKSA